MIDIETKQISSKQKIVESEISNKLSASSFIYNPVDNLFLINFNTKSYFIQDCNNLSKQAWIQLKFSKQKTLTNCNLVWNKYYCIVGTNKLMGVDGR